MSGSRGRRGPGGRRPARDGAWVFPGTQMWSRAGRLRRGLALPRAPAGRCLGCRGAPAERRTGRLPTRFRTFVLLSRKGLPLVSSVQRCSELARFRTLLISLSGFRAGRSRGAGGSTRVPELPWMARRCQPTRHLSQLPTQVGTEPGGGSRAESVPFRLCGVGLVSVYTGREPSRPVDTRPFSGGTRRHVSPGLTDMRCTCRCPWLRGGLRPRQWLSEVGSDS